MAFRAGYFAKAGVLYEAAASATHDPALLKRASQAFARTASASGKAEALRLANEYVAHARTPEEQDDARRWLAERTAPPPAPPPLEPPQPAALPTPWSSPPAATYREADGVAPTGATSSTPSSNRSALLGGGIALTTIGSAGLLFSSLALLYGSMLGVFYDCGNSETTCRSDLARDRPRIVGGSAVGLVLSLGAIAGGTALIVVGKRTPARDALLPEVRLGPGSAAATWHF